MKVLQFPLARITVGFVLGIIAAFYSKANPQIVFFLLFITFLALGITWFLSRKNKIPQLYFGLTACLLSFFIGMITHITHNDFFQKSNYSHYSSIYENPHLLTITLREKLKSSTANERYIAIVNRIDQLESTGRLILNIRKDSLRHVFQIGDILQIKTTLHKNSPPNNPNQFDYSKYLENKQIFAQVYTESAEIKIGTEIDKSIWYYTSKLRSKIIDNLEKSNFNKTELTVALALILGQQQDISPEIIRDYQYAGAVHILSVSGLHIGFILLFVTFILKPLPNTKRGSLLKLLIILASLSIFGLIAGLAPSVVRSVTMFSFVAIGNHLRRSVNIYHTLLVSILIILLFEPSFLFDVGFQLSYIALFFIIWLQPLLTSVWLPKNKITKYIWDILTVSFAAQIGTLPLSIYYFHQFPGLFFVTNLVIIPLLSIIMILGVLVMVLAAFGYVPFVFAKPLEWSVYYLNKIINSIASVEQFIIHNISFNYSLLISSYLFLIALIIWFKKPTFNKLILALITIIILQTSFLQTQYNIQNQQEWVVFNLKKNTLITERNGNDVSLYANDSILKITTKNSTLNTYLVGNFSELKTITRIQNVAFFKGKKIIIIDSLGIYPKNIKPDILVLTQSPKINLERLFQTLSPKIVVADASNYKTMQKIWKATCAKQKIPFHATGEKGFYKLN
ncbi:ComEC/Rec2 family competence protein [Flavobacterium xinjiangense]|uniref:Competence protein ComEC n=1 Tax=Flavobacterium xinjiangense TaxID=178356 RepID=A0A1M7FT72_9FLAO|nr:ComEC/Rec2 family competence protein [Flavobacterium xinjiangense]SHM07223.1 competence protein ComEC [Flavobacterium xinjiangense]